MPKQPKFKPTAKSTFVQPTAKFKPKQPKFKPTAKCATKAQPSRPVSLLNILVVAAIAKAAIGPLGH